MKMTCYPNSLDAQAVRSGKDESKGSRLGWDLPPFGLVIFFLTTSQGKNGRRPPMTEDDSALIIRTERLELLVALEQMLKKSPTHWRHFPLAEWMMNRVL